MFLALLIFSFIAIIAGTHWLYVRNYIIQTAIVFWILAIVHEFWLTQSCVGDCNIRIDWLFSGPLLLSLSAAAGLKIYRKTAPKND